MKIRPREAAEAVETKRVTVADGDVKDAEEEDNDSVSLWTLLISLLLLNCLVPW